MTFIGIKALTTVTVTGSRITWGTGGAYLLSYTCPVTGYYHAAASLVIFSGSNDNQNIYLQGPTGVTNLAVDTIPAIAQRGSALLTGTPFMTAGQQIGLLAVATVNPANQDETRTKLTVAFIPTQANPK